MFDEVTQRERGKGAGRRARFVLGATVLQALVVAAAIAATAFGAKPVAERLVPVTFVPPPPPAPPPAPAPPDDSAGPAGTPMPAARPARRAPPREEETPAPPPPPKLVQPQEVPEAIPPADAAPPEPEPASPGAEDGVVGGAPGGGGGAPVPGAVGPLGAPGRIVEDAPEDAAVRNLKPRLAEAGCLDRSQEREPELRDHPELAGRVVEVEFQVGPTGAVSAFRAIDRDVRGPLRQAMWSAIRRCRWTAGTDAEGRPAARTLSLKFRFE